MDYISAKNNWETFKKDFYQHPLKTVFILLVVIGVAYWFFIYREKPSSDATQVVNPYPPFEIEYKKLEDTKRENGVYKTIFWIIIKRPQGNFYEGYSISYDRDKMDCSSPDWKTGEAKETNGRQIYEKDTYNVDCISEKPIVDNGKLFGVNPHELPKN